MYRRILVLVADHASSQVAVAHGLGLARALGAELLFAHALRHPLPAVGEMAPPITIGPDDLVRQSAAFGARLVAEAQARAGAQGLPSRTEVIDCIDPVEGITRLARSRGCDLIVVGTEGGNALVRLLTGSAVPGLITRAAVPVMVCHAHDAPPAS